jgi:hypothetical protein
VLAVTAANTTTWRPGGEVVWAPAPSGSDDTATIQALIASDTIVQFRAGTYLFTVLNAAARCTLRGYGQDGRQTTLKFLAGTMTDDHQRNIYLLDDHGFTIENLIIDGNRDNFALATALVGTGVLTGTGAGTAGVTSNGITDTDAFYARVDNEIIYVTAGGTTNSWTITRAMHRTTAAAHSVGATITYLTGNLNSNSAIRCEVSDDVVLRNVKIVDARMSAMYMYMCERSIIEDCEVLDPWVNGILWQNSCHYGRATNNRVIRPGAMSNPTNTPNAEPPTLTSVTTGGTVAAGTYRIAVTWITTTGTLETLGNYATITTTGSTSVITVARPDFPTGITTWNMYATSVGGTTLRRQNGSALTGTTTTITAAPSTGGALIPTGLVTTDSIKGLGGAFNSADLTTVSESMLWEGNYIDLDTYGAPPNVPDMMIVEAFGCNRARIVNNMVLGPQNEAGHPFGISTGDNADSVNITGNICRRNLYFGIETAENSHGSRIESNYVDDYFIGITVSTSQVGARSDGHIIVGNEFRNGRAWAGNNNSASIQLNGECKRVIIQGNEFIDMYAVGVNLLGTNVQDANIANNLFVMKKQTRASTTIDAIAIATGSGHIISGNYFGPGPVKTVAPAETASTCPIRGVNITGGVGIERMLIFGNHFNGIAPDNSTLAPHGIQFNGAVDRTQVYGNTFENLSVAAVFQTGTPGTEPNYIYANAIVTNVATPWYSGLKDIDLIQYLGAGGGASTITSTVTLANTNTEQTLDSVLVPANWLQPGACFRLTADGTAGTTNTGPSMTWRLRIGPTGLTTPYTGTQIAATIVVTPASTNQSGKPWRTQFDINVRATGASGTVIGNGFCWNEVATTAPNFAKGSGITAPVAVDTTVNRELYLTFQWGTASASNDMAATNVTLERVK